MKNKKLKIGDILICKKTADDEYYAEYEKHSYKERTFKNWIHPEKDVKYTISDIDKISAPNNPLNLYHFENMLTIFNNKHGISNYIWDWFYTDEELWDWFYTDEELKQ